MRLIAACVLSGAFLLFLVQPLMGALLLPWFGGTPEVWTLSLLFFQSALLAGYAWAHWLVGRKGRWQTPLHLGLVALSLLTLPIGAEPPADPTGAPVSSVLRALSFGVGLPYLVLAANSTLMQAWAARLESDAPWRLYAWSNFGSLVAVLAWPIGVEPWLDGPTRLQVWSGAYGAFAVLAALIALRWHRASPAPPNPLPEAPLPGWRTQLWWVLTPALGSAMLIAVTEAMSAEVAVVPMLWIIPLGLYLLTWIVTFAGEPPSGPRPGVLAIALGVLALAVARYGQMQLPLITGLGLNAAGLFMLCMGLHLEASRRRPAERHLTRFYLALSLGGAVGGVLVGLVAPRVFDAAHELPIGLLAGLLCALVAARAGTRWLLGGALAVSALSVLFLGLSLAPRGDWEVVERRRGFFGSVEVQKHRTPGGGEVLHMVHGRVSHGMQILGRRSRQPQGYYARNSLGARVLAQAGPPRKVGLVGLGTGNFAALGRAGDHLRIYEISPEVIALARSPFTYLKDSPARIDMIEGDARLRLQQEPPQAYDLLVLDAFSSDAVPAHLLTRQAFELYRSHLKPEGVLVAHVSNNHLDVARLTHTVATALGLETTWRGTTAQSPLGPYYSQWMLIAPPGRIEALGFNRAPVPTAEEGLPSPVWVDGHTPLFPYLR